MTSTSRAIQNCIETRRSFLVDAGAGSGKTSSLVEALRLIVEGPIGHELYRRAQRVACITYTNVAKEQVIERIASHPLVYVSTIHEFLWELISPYQGPLKTALVKHNGNLGSDSRRKVDQDLLATALRAVSVNYSDTGPRFLEGRIFHDDLLDIAHIMFCEYSNMARVAAARFPYIFVDEYQDTSRVVVDILIGHILQSNADKCVVGFFGDQMQNIYHTGAHKGVGRIPDEYATRLLRIAKEENFRCSKAVIALLNRIRTDIRQYPAGANVEGSAVYLRLRGTNAVDPLTRVRAFLEDNLRWDLRDESVRELLLTHRLIARKAGYDELLGVFATWGDFHRDRLLGGEDERVGFFHDRVEPVLSAWRARRTGAALSTLRQYGLAMAPGETKRHVRASLDELLATCESGTVGDMVRLISERGIMQLPDEIANLAAADVCAKATGSDGADEALDERSMRERAFLRGFLLLKYQQVAAFCRFLDENTPFSTKHGVKGAEFNTVIVVLDDKGARWTLYSFDRYLSGEDQFTNPDRYRKTQHLFYVCCSRAIQNLAVVDLGADGISKRQQVRIMFGESNCYEVA